MTQPDPAVCPVCGGIGWVEERTSSTVLLGVKAIRSMCLRCRWPEIREWEQRMKRVDKSQMPADWFAPPTAVWYPRQRWTEEEQKEKGNTNDDGEARLP